MNAQHQKIPIQLPNAEKIMRSDGPLGDKELEELDAFLIDADGCFHHREIDHPADCAWTSVCRVAVVLNLRSV